MSAVSITERRSVWLVLGLVIAAFAVGSAGGYTVRAVSTPIAASAQRVAVVRITAPCPSGSHVVIWYTAEAWGCVSDAQAVQQK